MIFDANQDKLRWASCGDNLEDCLTSVDILLWDIKKELHLCRTAKKTIRK